MISKTRLGVSPAEGAAETIHVLNLNIYKHKCEMTRGEPINSVPGIVSCEFFLIRSSLILTHE